MAFDRPIAIAYFTNDVVVRRGEDRLGFFRLRADSPSINCVTDCCHTTLMVDNPGYQGRALLVFPDVAVVTTGETPAVARLFVSDYPPDKMVALPPISHPNEDWRLERDRDLPKSKRGWRFEELQLASGQDVVVLGLVEGVIAVDAETGLRGKG